MKRTCKICGAQYSDRNIAAGPKDICHDCYIEGDTTMTFKPMPERAEDHEWFENDIEVPSEGLVTNVVILPEKEYESMAACYNACKGQAYLFRDMKAVLTKLIKEINETYAWQEMDDELIAHAQNILSKAGIEL
jgi:hypothetical protein